jgi:hypothetical protein
LLQAGFLPSSLDPEDGGDMFIGSREMKEQYKGRDRKPVTLGEDGKMILKSILSK